MVTSGLNESEAKSRAGPAERTVKSGEFSSCILSALLGIFTQGLCGRPCIALMGFQTRAVRLHHLGQCWGRSGLPEIWPPIGSSRPMLLTASGGFWRGVLGLGFRVFHRLGKKNETFREGMISRAYKASSKFCNLFRSMDANTELDFDDADSWHGRSTSEISGSRPSVGWFKDLKKGGKVKEVEKMQHGGLQDERSGFVGVSSRGCHAAGAQTMGKATFSPDDGKGNLGPQNKIIRANSHCKFPARAGQTRPRRLHSGSPG